MNIKGKGLLLAAGVLGSILAAAPALAQHSGGGGGGGHAGGGGGHFSGGGGHMGGGGHAAGPAGGHFAGGAHFAAPGRGYAGGGVHAAYGGGYAGRAGYGGGGHYFAGRPGYGGGYRYGYSTGAYWRGGYWGGGFWPRAYYGPGFAWFLAGLPLAYSTYWWGGVPYYYANDVYYTYSPDYQGYVATDPPPVNAQAGDSSTSQPLEGSQPSDQGGAPPPQGAGGSANIFMYPKNGQSAEQQAQDRTECQSWATQQAGPVAQNGPDYQRAMVACVEGRGYSAR